MTTPFISSADLIAYQRLPEALLDENLADIALDSACEVVREYTGQTFSGVETTAVLDGNGSERIALPSSLVTAVTSATSSAVYLGDPGVEDEVLTYAASEIGFDADGYVFRYNGVFPVGKGNVSVVFTDGYTSVPSTIRLVALQVASRIYQFGQLESLSTGGSSETYIKGAGSLTAAEKDIIRRYKL